MPHHVTQRGNRRQETFFCADDYRAYLHLMRYWCDRHALRVWAYCLMPNHVHLIVVPPSEDALCRAIGEAHRRYTLMVNLRQKWRGHLWQGRFASFVMDEPHLMAAARYIERNPVRARRAERAQDWAYSSARAHVTGSADVLAESTWLQERTAGWVCTWGQYLSEPDADEMSRQLAHHENTGRPLGDKSFTQKVGALLGRDLIAKKPGPRQKG